ncbi:MAG: hypothetical protein ACRCX2_35315 [Paraclostridium sp.]
MRAFNKKKKPKHTTKPKMYYSGGVYLGKKWGGWKVLSLNTFTRSLTRTSLFCDDTLYQTIYRFGKLVKSRTLIKEER